jgi:hypothetical protein
MILLPGSPAIQAGDPALSPAGTTTDERGLPRLTKGKWTWQQSRPTTPLCSSFSSQSARWPTR